VSLGHLSIIGWIFEVLAIAALIFEAYAFIDVLRRPAAAFIAASKMTKPLWLVITGIATVIGLAGVAIGAFAFFTLAIVAIAAVAIYLVDVKPKVKDYRTGGSGTRMGPYGPW
jgi:ABC-type uncharacterized transport system permease subunit